MVRVCVAALFLPGTFESPESVVAALFLPSSLRSLWSPHCSYLRVSMYHNGVASSRPPGASLRIARHSILVVVLPFRSQQEEPRDESFPCHSEVSVRYRTGSSQFFPAVRCDVDVRLCALLRPFGVCISRVNHPRVRLGSGLVTAALATTASAAPAAAVMSTDEAAAKAAYLARLEAESPFYTKKQIAVGSPRPRLHQGPQLRP